MKNLGKIIVTCETCSKKMKITNKKAKYRCPYCKSIYELTIFKKIIIFFKNLISYIPRKIINMKNTIRYRIMLAKNLKNNRKK